LLIKSICATQLHNSTKELKIAAQLDAYENQHLIGNGQVFFLHQILIELKL